VVEPILREEELDALRAALGEAVRTAATKSRVIERDANPVALIADERASKAVRPLALRLATRWANVARQRLVRALGIKFELHASGAEVMHTSVPRDEFAATWRSAVEVKGRPGLALISVGGAVIEATAAELLGDPRAENTPEVTDRAPSQTAISIFTRAGEAIVSSLTAAWREEQQADVAVVDEKRADQIRFELLEAEAVLVVTLEVTAPSPGRIRLYARPEMLIQPPAPVKVTALSSQAVDAALGGVPIELRVELGRALLRMSEIKALKPGAMITLDQATDSLLPVRCAGVIKAFGRPAVSRGALAIEVVVGGKKK
jgi:flagellar motor switch protein FliM